MSNTVSALNGAFAQSAVSVRDIGLTGMISLRGDLSSKALRAVCTKLTGAAFPEKTKVCIHEANAICWMSPDEVLILVPYESAARGCAAIAEALKGKHHLATNVSDARAMMSVSGPYARDVMAKLAPVDLHPDSFGIGEMRRSRLGQVAAAFWMTDDTTFQVICFRSVARYAFDLLATSADAGPVDYLAKV